MNKVHLRPAVPADAPALLKIYSPYVLETAITFELTVPSPAEFRERIQSISAAYPYLVAEEEGRILGYAYGTRFKGRAAYDWAAETTVYVAQDARKRGVGSLLYGRLLPLLAAQGVQKAYACITWPNMPSVAFHQRMGFVEEGRFLRCGYKLGQWRDVIFMGKDLGNYENPPAPLGPPLPWQGGIAGLK